MSDEVDIENFALRHVTMHDSEKSALSPVVRQRNVLQLECVAPRHRESCTADPLDTRSLLATFGEFIGTFLFLFMAFISAQSAVYSSAQDLNNPSSGTKDNQVRSFAHADLRAVLIRNQHIRPFSLSPSPSACRSS